MIELRLNEKFDPGSGRTLAACLNMQVERSLVEYLYETELSGGRVSNA